MTSPPPALGGDILDRKGMTARDRAIVIREKLKAKRQLRKTGKDRDNSSNVGQCGVNIGNQFTDGRGRASRKTNITVVIDKPVVNLGECK